MFSNSYFKINEKSGISPFQNTVAYLGGSAIQTIMDNPVTAYRQLVQQYAKNAKGETISPKLAVKEANSVFLRAPINSSFSGLQPRLVGVLFKRIPKFGFLLGYDFFTGGKGEPGFAAATTASIWSFQENLISSSYKREAVVEKVTCLKCTIILRNCRSVLTLNPCTA